VHASDKPTIAIADDNPLACEVLAALLEDRYEVRSFNSGQAVLDALPSVHMDLLLLDVSMPGLDGYGTCRALRSGPSQADIPVIFLSAHSLLEDRLQGYAVGCNDYLVKPYEQDELQIKIQLAIDKHRQSRRLAGELSELSQAVSLTAEMMGEVGVVLEFQRALSDRATPLAIAEAIFAGLGRFGLEGCLRMTSGGTTIARSAAGPASALEASLLGHLASLPDARILTMGRNLGFSFGSVTLLVRCVAWAAAPDAPETIEAMERARDNVALMVEGAVARLRALAAEHDALQLVGAKTLIAMTRETLLDIERVQRELHRELDGVFGALRDEFEMRFPQLGLTAPQEDGLAEILTRHRSRGLEVLENGREAEARLQRLVDKLEQSPVDVGAAKAER
jgi:CheY-like chemotaxis protein